MPVRVIAGVLGGRRIETLRGRDVRPTLDRVREALFAILGDTVHGARVLDLFAGTGALGIEALSRGATTALFVDRDPRALGVLRRNIEALGLGERARAVRATLPAALRTRLREEAPFDIILADPPYRSSLAHETLALLVDRPWFSEWRCAVIETERETGIAGLLPPGAAERCEANRRVYGDTAVVILTPRAAPGG